jgi:hypothetical protein
VNMAIFERAQVASFAYRGARHTGSLDAMKAIVYVLRNRKLAGWGDGSWLWLLSHSENCAGNPSSEFVVSVEAHDRLLQLLVRDIDDIYLGTADDLTRTVVQDALYYHFIDKTPTDWLIANIVRQPEEHPMIGVIGASLYLYK